MIAVTRGQLPELSLSIMCFAIVAWGVLSEFIKLPQVGENAGPEERKLLSRIRFWASGRWPQSVIDERLSRDTSTTEGPVAQTK